MITRTSQQVHISTSSSSSLTRGFGDCCNGAVECSNGAFDCSNGADDCSDAAGDFSNAVRFCNVRLCSVSLRGCSINNDLSLDWLDVSSSFKYSNYQTKTGCSAAEGGCGYQGISIHTSVSTSLFCISSDSFDLLLFSEPLLELLSCCNSDDFPKSLASARHNMLSEAIVL